MRLSLSALGIDGLCLIHAEAACDARGSSSETYNERDFRQAGIAARFVQDNQSTSRRMVLRGLHYQRTRPQGKLVRVVSGAVFDVAVDLRRGSPTFGSWAGQRLSGEQQDQVYIPPGFAHGFLVLSDEAVLAYKCTDFYCPEDEAGIRWDDPAIRIAWPVDGTSPLLSEKDRLLPAFDPDGAYFDREGRPR